MFIENWRYWLIVQVLLLGIWFFTNLIPLWLFFLTDSAVLYVLGEVWNIVVLGLAVGVAAVLFGIVSETWYRNVLKRFFFVH